MRLLKIMNNFSLQQMSTVVTEKDGDGCETEWKLCLISSAYT